MIIVAGSADENDIEGVSAMVLIAGTATVAGAVVTDEAGVAARSDSTTAAVARAIAANGHVRCLRMDFLLTITVFGQVARPGVTPRHVNILSRLAREK